MRRKNTTDAPCACSRNETPIRDSYERCLAPDLDPSSASDPSYMPQTPSCEPRRADLRPDITENEHEYTPDAHTASHGLIGDGGSLFSPAKETSSPDLPPEAQALKAAEKRSKRLASERYRQNTYTKAQRARHVIMEGLRRQFPNARRFKDGIFSCGSASYYQSNMLYLTDNGRVYRDHVTCKSWACPICAQRNAYLRAQEIEAALLAGAKKGCRMAFVTFTISHTKSASCDLTRQQLQSCYTKLLNRRRIRRILTSLGYVHQSRSWDFTYGRHGWHPHIHAIWFFETDIDEMELCVVLDKVIREAWCEVVEANLKRKRASRARGFDCSPIQMSHATEEEAAVLARYNAKAISNYATAADKEASLMPFDLLVRQDHPKYKEYSCAFFDYYQAQKGIKRIRFSQGFREYFGIEDRKFSPPPQVPLAQLPLHQVTFLADENNVIELERHLRVYGVDDALAWLDMAAGEEYLRRLGLEDDYASELVRDLWDDSERSCVRVKHVVEDLAAVHEAHGEHRDGDVAAIADRYRGAFMTDEIEALKREHAQKRDDHALPITQDDIAAYSRYLKGVLARTKELGFDEEGRAISGLGAALVKAGANTAGKPRAA